MFQHGQQPRRGEILGHRLHQRQRQRAGRGEQQRLARRRVDGNAPAPAMRRHAAGKQRIGRDKRGALARPLQRLAQRQRHHLGFLGRGGTFGQRQAIDGGGRRWWRRRHGGRRGQCRQQRRRAFRRAVQFAAVCGPRLHVRTLQPERGQQFLQRPLRVARIIAATFGRADRYRVPPRRAGVGQVIIKAGQHHQPLRQVQHCT